MYRFGIQIISFNRPKYLKQTLDSLIPNIDLELDKICIIEQSSELSCQREVIDICKEYPNIHVIPLFKNLGQRGATNFTYSIHFWDDCDYVMISDHDNVYHSPISIYSDYLNSHSDIWIASGLI